MLSVREAAYHTHSNKFYQLSGVDLVRGWPFSFDSFHHRNVMVVKIGACGEEMARQLAILKRVSDNFFVQIVAFPCCEDDPSSFLLKDCQLHPNDESFKICQNTTMQNPVLQFVEGLAGTSIEDREIACFYFNRNSHLQAVAFSADEMLSLLEQNKL